MGWKRIYNPEMAGFKISKCVFMVTCQKNLGSFGIKKNFLLSTKPEIVVPGIRYLIFEISGKPSFVEAVFLPSLLSIKER
jgi:hypothetical protein